MYTPDGYMLAQLTQAGRKAFGSGDWFKYAPEESQEAASSYIVYSGPLHVDDEQPTLTHSMDVPFFAKLDQADGDVRGRARQRRTAPEHRDSEALGGASGHVLPSVAARPSTVRARAEVSQALRGRAV